MRLTLFFRAAAAAAVVCAALLPCRANDTGPGGMSAKDVLRQLRSGSANRAVSYFDSLPEGTEITLAMKRVIAPRLRMIGDLGRAKQLFEEILAEDSRDENAARGLAMTLFDVGDYEGAQRLLLQLAAGGLPEGIRLPEAVTQALGPPAVMDAPEPESTNTITVFVPEPAPMPAATTTTVVVVPEPVPMPVATAITVVVVTDLAPTCEVDIAVPVTNIVPEPLPPPTQDTAPAGEVAAVSNTVPNTAADDTIGEPPDAADHIAMLLASNKTSAALAFYELLPEETELPTALRRSIATAYVETGNGTRAAPLYASLFDENPADAEAGLAMVNLYGECDRETALAAADRVLKHHPKNVSVLLAKAQLESARNNVDAALDLCQRALALDATCDPARELCLSMLLTRARAGGAEANAYYERALAVDNSPHVRTEFIDALYSQGRTQEVITAYEAFPDNAPKPVGLLWTVAQIYGVQGNSEAAGRAYEGLLGDATNAAAVYPAYVELLIAEGRTQDVTRVLETYPNGVARPASLLAMMGRFYDDTGDTDKALAAYRELLTVERDNANVTMRLAEILTEREAYDEAMSMADQVLAVDTSRVDAVRLKATVCARKGAHAEAVSACEQLRALQADDEESRRVEKEALLALAREQSQEEAAATYEKLIELGGADGSVLIQQAELLVTLGRVTEAAAAFEQIDLAQCEPSQPLLRAVGEFYRTQRAFDKAIPVYQALVEKNPDDSELKRTLVVLYFDKGDFKNAVLVLDGPGGTGDVPPPSADVRQPDP